MKPLFKKFIDALVMRFVARYFSAFAKKSDIDNLYAQLASLIEINGQLGSLVGLGPLRGWAISPDSLAYIFRDLQKIPNPRVIEFGGGESTVAIASYLSKLGHGVIETIEHDSDFARKLEERLDAMGLSGHSRIHRVGMIAYPPVGEFKEYVSYDLSQLNFDFNLAIVDGPIMARFGRGTRIAPLHWCLERLGPGKVVFMDDAAREAEVAVAGLLFSRFSKVDREVFPTEKGLLVARFGNGCSV
jgi:predicted O-methyltransferase YrrM